MAGKHEPPTNSSFYLSLATSTLRAILLVAAVVVGVVVLARAFDTNASDDLAGAPGPRTSEPADGSPSASPSGASPGNSASPSPGAQQSPQVEGVVVQVRNGTSTTGLAASTSETLDAAGYSMQEPTNAEAMETTTLYFAPDAEAAAQAMQQRFFPDAVLTAAPDAFPADVDITVILGADYTPT